MSKPAQYVAVLLGLLLFPFVFFSVASGQNPVEFVSFRHIGGGRDLLISLAGLALGASFIYSEFIRLWNPDTLNPPWRGRRLLTLAVAFPILAIGSINGSSVDHRMERRLKACLSLGAGLVIVAMTLFTLE